MTSHNYVSPFASDQGDAKAVAATALKELFTRSMEPLTEAPSGPGAEGWSTEFPKYSVNLFGPVYRSILLDGEWTVPTIFDPEYNAEWSIVHDYWQYKTDPYNLALTSGLHIGTRSVKYIGDAQTYFPTAIIGKACVGAWRFKCKLRSADDCILLGINAYYSDPADSWYGGTFDRTRWWDSEWYDPVTFDAYWAGLSEDFAASAGDFGFYIGQTYDQSGLLWEDWDDVIYGYYPINNSDVDNTGYGAASWVHRPITNGMEIEMVYNGTTLDHYVDGVLVQTLAINVEWWETNAWFPHVTILNDGGEIYDIEWESIEESRDVDFPIRYMEGFARKTLDGTGFEINFPASERPTHFKWNYNAWIETYNYNGNCRLSFKTKMRPWPVEDPVYQSYVFVPSFVGAGLCDFIFDEMADEAPYGGYRVWVAGQDNNWKSVNNKYGTYTDDTEFAIEVDGAFTRMYVDGELVGERDGTAADPINYGAWFEMGYGRTFYDIRFTTKEPDNFKEFFDYQWYATASRTLNIVNEVANPATDWYNTDTVAEWNRVFHVWTSGEITIPANPRALRDNAEPNMTGWHSWGADITINSVGAVKPPWNTSGVRYWGSVNITLVMQYSIKSGSTWGAWQNGGSSTNGPGSSFSSFSIDTIDKLLPPPITVGTKSSTLEASPFPLNNIVRVRVGIARASADSYFEDFNVTVSDPWINISKGRYVL